MAKNSAVAVKVMRLLFVVARKEIGYMWNCSKNVRKIRREAEKLKCIRERVQEQINIRTGDQFSCEVEDWMKDADTEISKVGEFLEQEPNVKKMHCKVGLCGNWGTLHHYGKNATKMAPSLRQLLKSGNTYERSFSVYTPTPGSLDVYQNKYLDDLHTHNSALGDIIKSLEDESIQITGIYGLGGVGKTTLAMKIVARVVKNNMFAHVAFTTVSQNVDVKKIKKDIGEARKRIKKGEKILIILDDVWERLNLENLCIPCGNNYMNCKILLICRSEKLCQEMNAQSICLNSLPLEEAWILFNHVVGERLETDSNLKPVALEVVKGCDGLPLLIQAVGNALKDESIKSWESALTQLQEHAPSNIDEEIRKSYTQLKLSYDYLKSEDPKSCFLLCSMFPEDISLEYLVRYGVGLEKFDDLDSIEDARGRVKNAVNILTSSGLLLNSKRKGCTKMHDVVRDVALIIASQSNNKFLVKAQKGLTKWLPTGTSLKSYKGIALMQNHIIKLPNYKVNVPHLEIFLVFGNRKLSKISNKFIGCMKKVKVLDISLNNISSLPQSFQLLTKLRMLNLCRNKSLHEISILGDLKDLEILILDKTKINEIPKEIAHLVNLRVLHVRHCNYLSRIKQGIILALSKLEELRIEFKLKFKGGSESIIEIMSLPKLAYLDLTVPSIRYIPPQGQDFNFGKLKEFVIQIGKYNRNASNISSFSWSGRYLVLSRRHLQNLLVKRLKKLMESSRLVTILNEIKNINNMMPTLYDESFNNLEHIQLEDCPNVSCLVDDGTRCVGDEGKTKEKFFKELKALTLKDLNKLEVLWRCRDEYISLTNLVILSIFRCNKLERVFTVSVAKSLVNLNELKIESCEDLEEVIWGGDGGDDGSQNVIGFPSLTVISFFNLYRLKSFYSGSENCRIKYPSLVDVKIQLCRSMDIWGPGIHETPNLKTLVVNRHNDVERLLDGPNPINDAIAKARDLTRESNKQNFINDVKERA